MAFYKVEWEPDDDLYSELHMDHEWYCDSIYLEADSPEEAIAIAKNKSWGYSIIRWIDDDSYTAKEVELFREPLKLNKILNEINSFQIYFLERKYHSYYKTAIDRKNDSEIKKYEEIISLINKVLNDLKELVKIQLEIDNSNNIENLELEKQKELKLKEIRKQYNILFIEKEIDRY
ncbi:MAG: hypothetical protein II567_06200 [Candidatus Riflebacteria bacterium]|nr:hypothetical protein [Candidatus Riflebacteria bacterium]